MPPESEGFSLILNPELSWVGRSPCLKQRYLRKVVGNHFLTLPLSCQAALSFLEAPLLHDMGESTPPVGCDHHSSSCLSLLHPSCCRGQSRGTVEPQAGLGANEPGFWPSVSLTHSRRLSMAWVHRVNTAWNVFCPGASLLQANPPYSLGPVEMISALLHPPG